MGRTRLYAIFFAALITVYIILTFSLPPDPAVLDKYHITAAHLRFLNLTIVIPLLAIWCAAFYGFINLKDYGKLINRNSDGKAIEKIAQGLGWLAFGLPIASLINTLFNYLIRVNTDFRPTSMILQNYLNLIIYFISFSLISKGALLFVSFVNKKPNYGEQHVWVGLMSALAVIYTYLILNRPIFTEGAHQIYYLPDWLVLMTLALPYIWLWYMGLRSAYQMHYYQRTVKGELYRKALLNLTVGILFIILSSIFIQMITTLSARLDKLSLVPLLMLVYFLLIVISIGYLLVAAGANKMKRLEEA